MYYYGGYNTGAYNNQGYYPGYYSNNYGYGPAIILVLFILLVIIFTFTVKRVKVLMKKTL